MVFNCVMVVLDFLPEARLKRGLTVSEAQNTINVLSSQNLTLEDGGIYSCGGIYASLIQSFGASVTVNVRGMYT